MASGVIVRIGVHKSIHTKQCHGRVGVVDGVRAVPFSVSSIITAGEKLCCAPAKAHHFGSMGHGDAEVSPLDSSREENIICEAVMLIIAAVNYPKVLKWVMWCNP